MTPLKYNISKKREKLLHSYVYRITNIITKMHYYGMRSCICSPLEDLGLKYFSSSKDKKFIQDQKTNKCNYKYKIISVYGTKEKALEKEIRLHNKFNVDINPKFFNKAKQTSTKFCCSVSGSAHPNYGKPVSVEAKQKMSTAKKGLYNGAKGSNAKKAIIYNYFDGTIIAENVNIVEWCGMNKEYTPASLYLTASADRTLPSTAKNKHHHKGICALYLTDAAFEEKRKLYEAGKPKKEKQKNISFYENLSKGEKISLKLKGKPKAKAHVEASALSRIKTANIYNKHTNEIIASGVSIHHWCKENGYTTSKLCSTANYEGQDLDPNIKYYKNMYALYLLDPKFNTKLQLRTFSA